MLVISILLHIKNISNVIIKTKTDVVVTILKELPLLFFKS